MRDETLKDRLKAVEKLTQLFKLERMVHLIVTTVSLIMLLSSVLILIIKNQAGPGALTLMFGSSGLITYSASRLLRMWDQALRMLAPEQREGEN